MLDSARAVLRRSLLLFRSWTCLFFSLATGFAFKYRGDLFGDEPWNCEIEGMCGAEEDDSPITAGKLYGRKYRKANTETNCLPDDDGVVQEIALSKLRTPQFGARPIFDFGERLVDNVLGATSPFNMPCLKVCPEQITLGGTSRGGGPGGGASRSDWT